MSVEGFPHDVAGVEDRSLDTRADEMRRRPRLSCQHDAAIATAETAAHDLLERHIARLAMELRNRGDSTHHRRRAADIEPHALARRQRAERRAQRNGDEAFRAAAAIFG